MEKPLIKPKLTKKQKVLRLCYMGMLSALAVALVALVHLPIFGEVSFLEYDPGDIPLLICSFMMGTVPGLIVTAVVCLIQAFALGGNGAYGLIMHFIASGTLIAVSSLIYRRLHTRTGALISLISGSVAMVVIMIPANLLITTSYMGVTTEMVWGLMPFIIAFNAIKAFGNSAVVFLVYKPLHRLLGKFDK